jgi:hypothetical protein
MSAGVELMGVVRALVAIIVIAVAASPLFGGVWSRSEVQAVYADAGQIIVRDKKTDKDNEKKDQNRNSDEDSKGNRERTREERRSDKDNEEENDGKFTPGQATNTYGQDNYALQGQVVGLNCDAQPKQITIHTIDGDAILYSGPRDTDRNNFTDRVYCGDLIVGDYVYVQKSMKRDEGGYDAYYISCQERWDESPDNENDNTHVDPNCTHIMHR